MSHAVSPSRSAMREALMAEAALEELETISHKAIVLATIHANDR